MRWIRLVQRSSWIVRAPSRTGCRACTRFQPQPLSRRRQGSTPILAGVPHEARARRALSSSDRRAPSMRRELSSFDAVLPNRAAVLNGQTDVVPGDSRRRRFPPAARPPGRRTARPPRKRAPLCLPEVFSSSRIVQVFCSISINCRNTPEETLCSVPPSASWRSMPTICRARFSIRRAWR